MTAFKKNYMLLINPNNLEKVVKKLLEDYENNYIMVLLFKGNEFKEYLRLIQILKQILLGKSQEGFLNNVITISDVAYLPNDIDVRASITTSDVREFDIEAFIKIYNNSIDNFENINAFLSSTSDLFNFSYEYYIELDPWFYSIGKYGVLTINDKTYNNILSKYHMIKSFTTDIIFIILKGKDDSKNLSLLKMIGSDALLTIAITNIKKIQFDNNIDLILYNKSPNFERNSKEFVNTFLKSKKNNTELMNLLDFFSIEEKSFEADLFCPEEEVIKTPKKYSLKIENISKSELIRDTVDEEKLIFSIENTKKDKKYFIVEKDIYEE